MASLGPNPTRVGRGAGVEAGVPSILAIISVAVACMGDTPREGPSGAAAALA
jgi:hypothetical protein